MSTGLCALTALTCNMNCVLYIKKFYILMLVTTVIPRISGTHILEKRQLFTHDYEDSQVPRAYKFL